MVWFKVDDEIADSDKFEALPSSAIGLWVLVGAWCGRRVSRTANRALEREKNQNNNQKANQEENLLGFQLGSGVCGYGCGTIPKKLLTTFHWDASMEDAHALVEAGLWEDRGDYWMMHDYHKYNPCAADLIAKKRRLQANGSKGGRPRKRDVETVKTESDTVGMVETGGERVDCEEDVKNLVGFQNANQEANQEENLQQKPVTRNPLYNSLSHAHARDDPGTSGDYPTDFMQFWQVYPRKEGIADAYEAWRKARRKTNNAFMLAKAGRYANDPNRDPKFTLNPAKWLDGEHWMDDPQPEQNRIPQSASGAAYNAAYIRSLGEPSQTKPQIGGTSWD